MTTIYPFSPTDFPTGEWDSPMYRLAVTQLADLHVAMTVEAAGAALAPILTAHLSRRD